MSTKTHYQTKPRFLPLDAFVLAKYDGKRLHIFGPVSEMEAKLRMQCLTPEEEMLTCVIPVDFKLEKAAIEEKLTEAYNNRSEVMQSELDRLTRESN
ncbi:MAG: hypothetical protein Aurels2KO_48220 [Aureliella sp.]